MLVSSTMESDALPWVADGSYPEPSTSTTMIMKIVVNILTILYIYILYNFRN